MTAAPMSQCPDLARKEHANILLFDYLAFFERAPGSVDCCRSAILRGRPHWPTVSADVSLRGTFVMVVCRVFAGMA